MRALNLFHLFFTGPSEIRTWILDFRPLKFIFGLNPTIQIQLSGRPFFTNWISTLADRKEAQTKLKNHEKDTWHENSA
jgi:hypothetical protein